MGKPEDWDDEDDGEWEPPMVDNPYWEPWEVKMIPNPLYKGPWEHPKIPNPDYAPDDKLHVVCDVACTHVGFELWQVKSGTLFDDIIVTDSLEEAQAFAEETFFKKKDGEKEMFDANKEKERKLKEEEAEHDHDQDFEESDMDEMDEDLFG